MSLCDDRGLFVTDCVNVPQRSYGCALGPFPCQAQKALGQRADELISVSLIRQFQFGLAKYCSLKSIFLTFCMSLFIIIKRQHGSISQFGGI